MAFIKNNEDKISAPFQAKIDKALVNLDRMTQSPYEVELNNYRYYFSNSDRVSNYTIAEGSCSAWEGYMISGVSIPEYAALSEHFDDRNGTQSYWVGDSECAEIVAGALVQTAPCESRKQYICKKAIGGGSSPVLIIILLLVIVVGLGGAAFYIKKEKDNKLSHDVHEGEDATVDADLNLLAPPKIAFGNSASDIDSVQEKAEDEFKDILPLVVPVDFAKVDVEVAKYVDIKAEKQCSGWDKKESSSGSTLKLDGDYETINVSLEECKMKMNSNQRPVRAPMLTIAAVIHREIGVINKQLSEVKEHLDKQTAMQGLAGVQKVKMIRRNIDEINTNIEKVAEYVAQLKHKCTGRRRKRDSMLSTKK